MKARGRHREKALTAVSVRALKEPGRYTDGNGLYLFIDKNGAKRWILRTTVQGKRCDIGLGGVTLVSLAEAREQALALRKIARSGGDPIAERRKAKRIVPTFERAAYQVHEEHRKAWKNRKHVNQWINTLSQYVFPELGSRPVDKIDTPDVLRVLSPIWLAKPETARRVRQRIRSVLDWSKAAGFRSGENPIDGVARALPRQPEKKNHHAALPYDQVSTFIQSLHSAETTDVTRLAFEFLILTATRTGDVLGATWSEVDLDARTWTIPAERMKAGREHRVPLADRCLEIIGRAARLSADPRMVFPGQVDGKPLSNMVFLMMLRRMQMKITAHGFRSSFRDWTAECTNFPRDVCEMALAHTIRDKTEAAYRRGDLFEKRRALMDAWADFVLSRQNQVVALPSRTNLKIKGA